MNGSTQSPWPAIIKIALLIGCTMGFCILGLISGVLAAKVMQHAGDVRGDELLVTVLMPPVVGAVFGFFVGMISTLFVRWRPQKTYDSPPHQTLTQPPVSTPPV
jgi:NhaP-type Na+/H+ or K+/H+ antiporter